MRAFKLIGPGEAAIQEVERPVPGKGEVLIKVEAAGLCHSDIHLTRQDENWPFYGTTMGHETAGTIAELGPGADAFKVGDRVLVRAIWSCGECRHCRTGRENACSVTGTRTQFPASPGIVVDGGMAEFMLSNQAYLTPIGDLEATVAAPLADAGMTPMHAVNSVEELLDPEAVVVLIGVGGLGHVALQILMARETPPSVYVVDLDESKREHAVTVGAKAAFTPEEAVEKLKEITGESGADVVIDFVGNDATLKSSTQIVGSEGAIRAIGLSGGSVSVEATLDGEPLPWGVNVERSYGGTADDVDQVIALARAGKLTIGTTEYPLDQAKKAFEDLEAGRVAGRAVLVP